MCKRFGKFLGRSDGSLEKAETDTTSFHPCCKVARPLGNLLSGGRGELGAQYEIRSPLPAMSLSISKIRKRELVAGLSLVETFEIQSNERNEIPFPMPRRTKRQIVL